LTLAPADVSAKSFDLDLRRAVGTVELTRGRVEAFCCATTDVILVRSTDATLSHDIVAPFNAEKSAKKPDNTLFALWQLGYPPPENGSSGDVRWTLQQGAEGFAFAVVTGTKRTGNGTTLAIAIVTNQDDADPVTLGRRRVEEALGAGFDAVLAKHEQWWRDF